jgi:hypothetical protein
MLAIWGNMRTRCVTGECGTKWTRRLLAPPANRAAGVAESSLLALRNDAKPALKVSALRNLNSFGSHQAGQRSIAAEVNTVAGLNISDHPTNDYDFASRDVGKNLCILSNRDAAVGNPDHPFDMTLDDQRLRPYDFALDPHALANRYRICSICRDK